MTHIFFNPEYPVVRIDKYTICGLTCHQVLEDILEDDVKHTRPYRRSHPVVHSTVLDVRTSVLVVCPEDGCRYLDRIETTHGDIGSGFF
jgi:hypothetical protein